MKRIIATMVSVALIFSMLPVYATEEADIPTATDVAIDGIAYAGGSVKGTYTYNGVGEIPQGESRFRWLMSDSPEGEFQPLENETAQELVITEAHLQKYLVFEVTPVGEDGTEGAPVMSEPVLEQSVTEIHFDESFESIDTDISDADGWVLSTAGGTISANGGCLELTANGTAGSTVGAERRFAPVNGIFILEFVFSLSEKQPTNMIYAYEGSAYVFNITADANNLYVWVGNGGFESAKQERLLTGYQANTPYRITATVNTYTDRMSIAINSETMLENAYLRKDVTTGVNKFLSVFASNLTGVLSFNEYRIIKYIKNPEISDVITDAETLTLDTGNGITEDILLPTEGANGSTIRWESSHPDVISPEGKVTRSTEEDIDVILTAYLKKGNSPEIPVEFTVKVLQFVLPPAMERINSSLASIKLPEGKITDDIELPTRGDYDVVISWTSSDEDVISTEGKVTRPSKDTNVTLTATASAGGESAELNFTLKVKGTSTSSGGGGSSGGGSSGGGGSRKNKRPAAAVAVPPAAPQPETTVGEKQETVYTDLENHPWAEEAIMYLTVKGVVQGTGNSVFEPERNITREEFVHMIVKAFEITSDDSTEKFDDVTPGSWYEKSVTTASGAGIVKGIGSNIFGTEKPVTRQDAAVILHRVLKAKNADMYSGEENTFSDNADIAEYALESVNTLWTNDIVNGSDGRFYPQNNMTRAEACKLLYASMLLLQRR